MLVALFSKMSVFQALDPYRLHDAEIQKVVTKQLAYAWDVSLKQCNSSLFPVPVSLLPSSLKVLRRYKYVVSEKSDGERFLLILGSYKIDHVKHKFSVFVSREFHIFHVFITAPLSLFNGSIFDGEILENKSLNSIVFSAFDIVQYKGVSTIDSLFMKRYAFLMASFDPVVIKGQSVYVHTNSTDISYKIKAHDNSYSDLKLLFAYKRFFPLENISFAVEYQKKLLHASDGLIFTPIYSPVQRGKHKCMFKFKPISTIDLRVYQNEDKTIKELEAMLTRTKTTRISILNSFKCNCTQPECHKLRLIVIPTKKGKQILESIQSGDIVEFSCAKVTRVINHDKHKYLLCEAFRIRPDKSRPNDVRSIMTIYTEVMADIKLETLLQV